MPAVDLEAFARAGAEPSTPRRIVKAMRAAGILPWGGVVGFTALALVTALCETFGLALIYPLLTYIEAGGDVQKLAASSKLWRVLADAHQSVGLAVSFASLAACVWLLVLLRQGATFLSGYVSGRAKEDFTLRLRRALFDAVIGAKPAFLHEHTSGAVAGWFGQTAQQAGNSVTIAGSAVVLGCTILIYVLGLILITPLSTLAAIVLIGIFGWLLAGVIRSARATSRDYVRETESYASAVSSRLRNWRLVKLNVAEQREARELGERAARPAALYLTHVVQAGKLHLFVAPTVMAGLLLAIYVATSHFNLSLAMIAIFVVVIVRLTPSVEALARLRQSVELSGASLGRLLDIIDDARRQREIDTGHASFFPPKRGIRFADVTFGYKPGQPPALDRVNLELPAGCMIAIVGPSGAGKTTLVNALTRLIEPQSGSIFVDDVPLAEFALPSLRRGIAVVDQDTQVLPGSIEENLRYAKADATSDEIARALSLAGALEFVEQMPQKAATPVGEDGVLLSGGQRQRIALARAFLGEASVIILDEPTSALDFEAEAAFRAGLRATRARGNVTLLVIAHRPATISDADFVVVLNEGRVEEAAKPETLRRDPGYYRKMIEVAAAS